MKCNVTTGFTSYMFQFHDFANLRTTKNRFVTSPKFTCFGHQWELRVFPGGDNLSAEGKVSAYLAHLSKGTITATVVIKVIDMFGRKTEKATELTKKVFDDINGWGNPNFISHSKILDRNFLDFDGSLTIDVWIGEVEESTTEFVPKNTFANIVEEMFNDEDTADICFEVNDSEGREDNDRNKKVKTTTPFYAHSLILQKRAPILAAICGSNDSGGVVTASVDDIKPHIFNHLLSYVYGGVTPEEELKTHAKDIIDAADKYSIVNLKLAAEAAYVKSTDISLDNAMDNLLYADSRNCALLKEAVMDFLADNHHQAALHISFADFPGHIVKDLLIAFSRNGEKGSNETTDEDDELATLRVGELRRKLHKMGKDVDGSREAMIESIKTHSKKSLVKLARAGVYDAELSDSESESEEESESSESESEEE